MKITFYVCAFCFIVLDGFFQIFFLDILRVMYFAVFSIFPESSLLAAL